MSKPSRPHRFPASPVPMGFDQITCKGVDYQAGCVMSDGSRCPEYKIGHNGCFYYNGDQPWPDLDGAIRDAAEAALGWLLGGSDRKK